MNADAPSSGADEPIRAYEEFSPWILDLRFAKEHLRRYVHIPDEAQLTVSYAQLKPSKYYDRHRMRAVYRVSHPAAQERVISAFRTPNQCIVHELPDDPELPALAALFERFVPEQVLTYRAGVRCTWSSTWNGQPVVCKHFATPGLAAQIQTRFEHFRQQLNPALVDFPRVLTVEQNTIVTERLAVRSVSPTPATLHRIGEMLGAWHKTKMAAPVLPIEEILEENENKLSKLYRCYPNCHVSLAELRENIAAYTPSEELSTVITHGDFHLRQLGEYEKRLFCFDLDECCLASRHRDLASMILSLYYDDQMSRQETISFLQGYQMRMAVAVPTLNWYLHVQLLNKIYRGYVQVRYRDRDHAARQMRDALDFVRRCCHLLTAHSTRAPGPTGASAPP